MSLDCPDRQDLDYLAIWEYALDRWVDLFRMHGDPAVLTVIDETRADAGYTTAQCPRFYKKVIGTKSSVAHYRAASNVNYLKRCWDDDEEIAEILRAELTPAVASGAAAVSLTACEADRSIDGLGMLSTGAITREVTKLVKRVAKKEAADQAGAEYFYRRLALRYRLYPNDGILAGVDAVAGANATPGICRFWSQIAGGGDFASHYRRPGKRDLLLRCPEEDLPRADILEVLIQDRGHRPTSR